ncbi:alpha/beta fold hydrolase [Streptomyces sp. NPDC015130]|uniref:alpha/beta fold hydrolase n=1 Tax=Streptomyces sp. NPDC015130 TaxID=3364940 RepID=UPI0036FD66EA
MDEVKTLPDRAVGRVTSRDGTTIAYERYGDGAGPPLVLVSGSLRTAGSERPLAALLARRFTVVTYDRRGRGGSGDTGPYAVEREIEDLAAVAAEAGSGAALYGAGTGGVLALAAVAAGLSTGPVSVYEPPYSAEAAALHRRAAELLGRGRPDAALDVFLAESGVPAGAWPGGVAPAPTLAYDHAVLGDGTVPERSLAGVHARVLVVDGGASPGWARRAAHALTAALPRARHRTLTGQTHEAAPHVLAPVLEEFLVEDREASEVG